MKILLDHGTPAPLRRSLPGHSVDTAVEKGWETLANGDLLNAAEHEGYDVLITTDQSMRHQQNLIGKRLAIVVLLNTTWSRVQRHIHEILDAVEKIRPGEAVEVPIR